MLKGFFTYNNYERKGIILLVFLLLIVVAYYHFIPNLYQKEIHMDDEALELKVNAFLKQRELERRKNEEENTLRLQQGWSASNLRKKKKLTPFPFNPNGLSISDWKKIGLSDKQISVIKNYEKSGGQFYKKSDLKKIYGLSEDEYNQLESFIQIPYPKSKNKSFSTKSKPKSDHNKSKAFKENINKITTRQIDINVAQVEDIRKVKGLGDVLSNRIVKYRNLLGGFYTIEQLKEVYGINEELYTNVKNVFYIENEIENKININYATFKDIVKHPYFSYEITKSIINYREDNGPFQQKNDMKQVPLMIDDLFDKIAPYIEIE